ncbi:MAG: type II toxin-antitoxin system RelE/ParE family toxin [Candidatus Melainabacteria bacterium]|nr:type II toxin-antitoxin system RelE/ParE family toxin [Candidatus Melainabacteria bacterium]
MKTLYSKKFLKDLAKISKNERTSIEVFVFETLVKSSSLSEAGKCEKLRGHQKYYKARFGDYRIGLKQEGEALILERVLHRKDIYRYFP